MTCDSNTVFALYALHSNNNNNNNNSNNNDNNNNNNITDLCSTIVLKSNKIELWELLEPWCPFCRPTNRVKALKGYHFFSYILDHVYSFCCSLYVIFIFTVIVISSNISQHCYCIVYLTMLGAVWSILCLQWVIGSVFSCAYWCHDGSPDQVQLWHFVTQIGQLLPLMATLL